jgi:pyruvate,orthophosphate dikinase
MPGMMDTVLNLGLNKECLEGLIKKTNNPRFVWDSYRRFIQMFSNIVMDTEHSNFEKAIDEIKKAKGVKLDTELDVEDLKKLVEKYMEVVKNATHRGFPEDTKEQLLMSIEAVCRSWNNPRAISYRRLNDIKGLLGTAVNVQTMVFGNMGETSGTGVAFSRDPSVKN